MSYQSLLLWPQKPGIVPGSPCLDKDSCKDLDETPPRPTGRWRSCDLASWVTCKTTASADTCCHRSCHLFHTLNHLRGQTDCSLHRSLTSPPGYCCQAADSFETCHHLMFTCSHDLSYLAPVVDTFPCLPVPQERLFLYPLMKQNPMSNVEQTSNSDVNNLINGML